MTSFHDNNSKSRSNLNQVIQDYRLNRERLVTIQTTTKEAFVQLTDILKSSTATLLECINTEKLNNVGFDLGAFENVESSTDSISSDKFFNKKVYDMLVDSAKVEIGNPAIAVVGQVKAGKSTFVNVLVRKNAVPRAFERCTARLTRLTYSSSNFMELIDIDGTVLKRKKLKTTAIPKKYLHLNESDRNNPLEIGKQVRAGIKSEFLQCGIDIIDSPGLSENPTLTNLSKEMIRNILPVMIYVIDGRGSVKQTDISDLLELKNSHPNLQIIYFVTKLDTEDLSESDNTDSIQLAERKMEIAFQKLQYNNFIPKSFNHWSECPYFHGASLYSCMDYYNKKLTPENVYHFEMFSKFESALLEYLVRNFENKISESSDIIIKFLMDVVTKIIHRAKALSDFSKENMDQISLIKTIEENLFETIKKAITNSKSDLKIRLAQRIEEETNSIINPIAHLEYPNSFKIPENGMVVDKRLIEKCQSSIMFSLCQGLENVVKQFVEEELFQKYRNAIDAHITSRMQNKIQSQNKKNVGRTSYGLCLERMIVENYKIYSLSSDQNSENYTAITKLMNEILTSIKRFFTKLFTKSESYKLSVNVKSPEWKLQQAQECLKKCDNQSLAEDVCRALIDDFKKKHNSFLLALEYEHKFMQKKIMISEEIRMDVAEKAPDFAGLLMLTLDVKCRYMLHGVERKEKIGQGGQGKVFRCIYKGKEIAQKTIKVEVNQLNEIAEEIFYSYSFEHPNLLPLIAISIADTKSVNHKKVSIYSPLMKSDVMKYIRGNITTLPERLQIGLQVVLALQYLHRQQIMHRDLKLANILIDENNWAYLADFGLCKSMALTGFSYTGTPLHIAPEIVRGDNYDSKVDIYSLGILLWYLSEGKGQHPKYARFKSNVISIDMRPEQLDNIPNELWDLMESCWDKDPSCRPDINIVISKMNEIISNIS